MGVGAELVLVEGVFLELVEVGIEAFASGPCSSFRSRCGFREPMDRGTGSLCLRGSGKMLRRFLGKGYSLSPNATAPVLR